MSETKDFPIVGSYNHQAIDEEDSERSVNLYVYIDQKTKKGRSLINTSGLIDTETDFISAANGFRAQFVFQNFEYDVIGTNIYRRSTTGLVTKLNPFPLTTFTGYVGVDANTFQIIFVDGQKGYIWDTTALTFEQITDSAFPANPVDVCYLDGFFIVANGGTKYFQLSMFNQGLVWGPAANDFTASSVTSQLAIGSSTIGGSGGTTNYQTGVPVTFSNTGGALPMPLNATDTYYAISVFTSPNVIDPLHIKVAISYANAIAGTFITLTTNGTGTNVITSLGQLQQGSITTHPGTIVGCRTLHRRLFLFSQNFTEVWENAGIGTNLPFRRNNSLLLEYGTAALWSISVGFDKLFFLSQNKDGLGPVVEVVGTQSIPVSNRALDYALAAYATLNQITDCSSFLIKEGGLIFYRINFTLANHTYIYNVTLSDPSEDQTKLWHEEEVLNGDRHPAQTHAYFNGTNYVGNYLTPILYEVDNQTYTNAGEAIRRMRTTQPIVPPGYNRLRIDRLQVDLLQGNIAMAASELTSVPLLTELDQVILTENDVPILLEQGVFQNMAILNPYAYLSLSKDGGQTFGYTVKAPMGNIGQRSFRTVWRKLGTIPRGQAFVAKFEWYDPIPIIILGAAWAFEVMPE